MLTVSPNDVLPGRLRAELPEGFAENQIPRLHLVPEGLVYQDHGEDAVELARDYGLDLDPWQELVVRTWLGTKPDGTWAASRCGCSVPRQNGKNSILEAVELYLIVGLGYKVLHTAHEGKTSRKAFQRIGEFFTNPREYPQLYAMVTKHHSSTGSEIIELNNGGSVEFIARTRSSGRGFTADVLVMDEAQELNDEQLGTLNPTISAGPHNNPLQIYTGTPPTEPERGLVWWRIKNHADRTLDPDDPFWDTTLAWLEWSIKAEIDEDNGDLMIPDLDDQEIWWWTNPAYKIRINEGVVLGERGAMEEATFARERCGMWSPEGQLQVIPDALWKICGSPDDAPESGPIVYAVDINPEQTWATIVACRRLRGQLHTVVMEAGSCTNGTDWIIRWLNDPKRVQQLVVVDAQSPAASLIPTLLHKRNEKKLLTTTTQEFTRACGGYLSLLKANRKKGDSSNPGIHYTTHHDQKLMNDAIKAATKRKIGAEGGWGWNRIDRTSDITPIVAASLATYAMEKEKKVVTRGPVMIRAGKTTPQPTGQTRQRTIG